MNTLTIKIAIFFSLIQILSLCLVGWYFQINNLLNKHMKSRDDFCIVFVIFNVMVFGSIIYGIYSMYISTFKYGS